MSFGPGEQLGPYQIIKLIGKGGMGEVYQATDTRLHRSVAIKTSKREFNDRFEREAHAIAAINHPNICTLYDVGPNYLVMEFVEGELLSKLLERGPLALDKALTYAVQIADALIAAHAKGIIHRDLKPANMIVTSSGIKVLDFGLAKLAVERMPSEIAANAETLTAPLTQVGGILGTLYYMAPEQVEGKEAGERSDIFSLGVCLYEMLTAQHPFTGDTQAAVLAAVLKDNPTPIGHRQPATPRSLDRIIRRCLEKRPEDRWQTAREVKAALETIDLDASPIPSASTGTPVSAPIIASVASAPSRKWLKPAAATAVLLLAGLAYVGGKYAGGSGAPAPATRFQVELPRDVVFQDYMSLSPDGRKLLFTAVGAKPGLWIRDLDTLEWRQLPGTETSVAYGPGWSPDGRFITYGASTELKKIDLAGGPAITLGKTPGTTIGTSTWTADGSTIIFGSRGSGPLYRVSSNGGVPEPLTALDNKRGETANSLPSFLPDGEHFLYVRVGTAVGGVYVGSLNTKPEDQTRNPRILDQPMTTVYANGKLFFLREGTLMAQDFDTAKLTLTGSPVPIAQNVANVRNSGMFAVSRSGVLAYRQGPSDNVRALLTGFYDRTGKLSSRLETPGAYFVLSPDGKQTVSEGRAENTRTAPSDGLWLFDRARSVRTRLTFQQDDSQNALWSPDGSRVYYTFQNAIYEKNANGSGEARELFKSTWNVRATDISGDGRFLLYTESGLSSKADIFLLPLKDPGTPVALLQTPDNEGAARFAPDGRWIVYQSDASKQDEIYVRPFLAEGPGAPKLGEGRWQVSKSGGTAPRWSKKGREIVFRVGNRIHAVPITPAGNTLQLGLDAQLFGFPVNFTWDLTSDGEKFLVTSAMTTTAANSGEAVAPITVVLNWDADLKRK